MAKSSRREHRHRRRDEQQLLQPVERHYRNRRDSALSEEVSVSPSKSVDAPSLPYRQTASSRSGVSTNASELTLCVDQPSAVCPSMIMSENDSKTTYQMRDGSLLEILDKADSAGKTVSLKLKTGEQIFVERSDKGHSLMMLDRKSRVVHAVGTDWKEPERVFRA